jgi:hypothetical protein
LLILFYSRIQSKLQKSVEIYINIRKIQTKIS